MTVSHSHNYSVMLIQDHTISNSPGGVVGLGLGVSGERGCDEGSSEGGDDGNRGINVIGGKGEGGAKEVVGSGGGEDDGADGLGGTGLGLGAAAQCVEQLRCGQMTVESRSLC